MLDFHGVNRQESEGVDCFSIKNTGNVCFVNSQAGELLVISAIHWLTVS